MSAPAPAGNSDGEEENSSSSHGVARNNTQQSPLSTMSNDFRAALDEFRDNWQRELKCQNVNETLRSEQLQPSAPVDHVEDILPPLKNNKYITEAEKQTLAENLFRRAVELEQRGKVYDALPLYRKATQIIPDIEFKFYERQNHKIPPSNEVSGTKGAPKNLPPSGCNDANSEFIDDLYEKFQMDIVQEYGGKLLLSGLDPNVISTELHISDLPPEILLYILRWVVSTQLDLHSLEQCAAVCKGLYLCARDEELWRLACLKVWGVNVGTLENPGTGNVDEIIPTHVAFSSWRQMFIERDRVLFNGCYISKTTYLRLGENSFQDQYYRPVQMVEYYRYIRFLTDSTVLMMTNADEPITGVGKLKHLQQLRTDVLRGHYRLYGDTVTILLCKQQQRNTNIRNRRGSSMVGDELNSIKYCLEFRIVNTPKRKYTQLVWLRYSVVQIRNKIESTSDFDVTTSKYPPLWFSPVRSYHLDADAPLA